MGSSILSLNIANAGPAIHGDKQQNERDWVLNEFKTGKSPIMVATDVASRGIGMIDRRSTPAPAFAFPNPLIDPLWLYFCEASLSPDVGAAAAAFWSRLVMISFGWIAKSSWISVAVWLATSFIPSRYVPSGYRGGLDFS